jgi:hypothetical protein
MEQSNPLNPQDIPSYIQNAINFSTTKDHVYRDPTHKGIGYMDGIREILKISMEGVLLKKATDAVIKEKTIKAMGDALEKLTSDLYEETTLKLHKAMHQKISAAIAQNDPHYKYLAEQLEISQKNQNDRREEAIYDIVYKIDSMAQLKKEGWKIEVNTTGAGSLNEVINQTLIGVVGLPNRGKTQIINTLADVNVGAGFAHSTEGISIKLKKLDGKTYVYMDSKGVNSSVPINKYREGLKKNEDKSKDSADNETEIKEHTKKVEEAKAMQHEFMNDNQITEHLIQSYIVDAAPIIIVMVGMLTYADQRLIYHMVKYQREHPEKQVFIIHNFLNLTTPESVEAAIKQDIIQCFPVEPKDFQGFTIYCNKDSKRASGTGSGVTHLPMARNGSTAGGIYNSHAIKYLKSVIEVGNDAFKKINFTASFLAHGTGKLKHYIELPENNGPNQSESKKPTPILLIDKTNSIIMCDLISDSPKEEEIKEDGEEENKRIENFAVKRIYVDALGCLEKFQKSNSICPPYAVFQDTSKNVEKKFVLIFAPEVDQKSFEVQLTIMPNHIFMINFKASRDIISYIKATLEEGKSFHRKDTEVFNVNHIKSGTIDFSFQVNHHGELKQPSPIEDFVLYKKHGVFFVPLQHHDDDQEGDIDEI